MSLIVNNLTKSFGDKLVIDDFSAKFPEKGLYLLLGESGVGKTTLLRMISGLDTDYSGEIIGGGFPNTSFAFQEYRLFPTLSAIDNIVCAVSEKRDVAARERAMELLSELGFSDAEMSLAPHELSGGMKQRVSLARAIARSTPLLLLDEPTKELDDETRVLAVRTIAKEKEKRLIIVVTHQPDDFDDVTDGIINLKKASF